eukprot:TRINITY_DN11695_c0_g1_i7.p1 TRINITY_DN11695_c0_g1~~TRINITY_DN11695_c0_g1_i7.p1  ORF type:complete len:125 (+),score=31.02 TRINITY_DN11695_c0_g1_i7:206-580(+)
MEQDGDEEEHQTPCFQPPALRVEDLRGRRLVLANLSNGIMYPHDDVCYFASQMAHHKPQGYFNAFAMPIRAVIVLLLGTRTLGPARGSPSTQPPHHQARVMIKSASVMIKSVSKSASRRRAQNR